MNAIALHINFALIDGRVIARTVAERRLLARAVLRYGRKYALLAFRLVDTHLHLHAGCGRRAAGLFVNHLKNALVRVLKLPVSFTPAHYKAIDDQRHLRNSFDYVLRQERRHDVVVDPYFEASNLPDLLGLRVTGRHTVANVRALLPRIKRTDLLAHFDPSLRACLEDETSPVPFASMPEASAAAFALSDLEGRSPDAMAAKRVVVQLAPSSLASAELTRALGISQRTLRRIRRTEPVSDSSVQAVVSQARLRRLARIQESGSLPLVTSVEHHPGDSCQPLC